MLNKYNEILDYIKRSKGRNWVVQKYIERPLIINRKKFDIRQWVLVTDWNPLIVYIYNECYIRFAAMEYDTKNRSKFAHLTNNVITKEFSPSPQRKKKARDASVEQDEEGESSEEEIDNIWSLDDFKDYLNKNHSIPESK